MRAMNKMKSPLTSMKWLERSPRHFLIPWTGGAYAPLGPFLCPTTEEKIWPIAPQPGPYGPVYTIPDYFSYRINFHSEVKNKGIYTMPFALLPAYMSFTVAIYGNKKNIFCQYTKIY
jgi:hypothetical protein